MIILRIMQDEKKKTNLLFYFGFVTVATNYLVYWLVINVFLNAVGIFFCLFVRCFV